MNICISSTDIIMGATWSHPLRSMSTSGPQVYDFSSSNKDGLIY